MPRKPLTTRLWEQAFRDTLTPAQLRLFEAYQEAEFHREETDREALFRFLLHTP